MKSISFYIYIKEIIGTIMNIQTLKENMRRFKTKNVLFEQQMTPEAESHWAKYPIPEFAEAKFREFLNKHPKNKAKFGPGTDFDIDPVKPESEPILNDFVKLAWYDVFTNQNKLFNNMMKNDFAMLKQPTVEPAKLKTANQKIYNIMAIRKPGLLEPNQEPIENPKDLRIVQRGTIDPNTGKQTATEYLLIGVVGEGWKLNSSIGSITRSKDDKWYWKTAADIGQGDNWGGRFMGKLGFSKDVERDDKDNTSFLGGRPGMSDPIEGGLKFYGTRDKKMANKIQSQGPSFMNGVNVGIDEVNNLFKKNAGALFASPATKNAIRRA